MDCGRIRACAALRGSAHYGAFGPSLHCGGKNGRVHRRVGAASPAPFRGLKSLIEQIVYFTLGFVICGLIGLAFLPLVSARARRLTLARIEARLPMTFEEIEAERDLLRARFAVEKRAQEIETEQVRAGRAEDSAELGRRAVAVMRANEHLQKTEKLLRERDAQFAKAQEFGEKTQARLMELQESLAARKTELTQKCNDYVHL